VTKIEELENIRVRWEQGENPTELMNEMEDVFNIPALNNLDFNEENPEVIELYREISKSRRISDVGGINPYIFSVPAFQSGHAHGS